MTDLKEQLAAEFSARLALEVGVEKLQSINAANLLRNDSTCASHDHCDANVVMLGACEALGIVWQQNLETVNAAWATAKLHRFFTPTELTFADVRPNGQPIGSTAPIDPAKAIDAFDVAIERALPAGQNPPGPFASAGGHNRARYEHGFCHLYALTALEIIEGKLKAAFDLAALDEELAPLPPVLLHCWIELPDGRCFDAAGVRDLRDVEDSYFTCAGELDIIDADPSLIATLIQEGALDAFQPREKRAISVLVLEDATQHALAIKPFQQHSPGTSLG